MAPKNELAGVGHNPKWTAGFCREPASDGETCCLGCWAPCVLYGETQYRLTQKAQGKNPFDLTGYNAVNKECLSFLAIGFVQCGWACAFAQHLQVKGVYGISSNLAVDCVQTYFCTRCTLMQDEREVRAREKQATINFQPWKEPQMQYAPDSQTPLHRPSLVRAVVSSPSAAQIGGVLDNLGSISSANISNGAQKLQKCSEVSDTRGRIAFGTGSSHVSQRKRGLYNLTPAIPTTNSTTKSIKPNFGDKDAIIVARQPWRVQKAGKSMAISRTDTVRVHSPCQQRTLARYTGNNITGSECQKCSGISHTIPGRCVSEPTRRLKGKSVRRSNSSGESFGLDLTNGIRPGSNTRQRTFTDSSEAVLIYYSDGESPQRHRLADCTRTRASTLGRLELVHYERNMSNCASEQVASGSDLLELQKQDRLAACTEIPSDDGSQNFASRHTKEVVQRPSTELQLNDGLDDSGSHANFMAEEVQNEAPNASGHTLMEFSEKEIVNKPAKTATKEQHNLAEGIYTIQKEESAETGVLQEHLKNDHVVADGIDSLGVSDSEHRAASTTPQSFDIEHALQSQPHTSIENTMADADGESHEMVITGTSSYAHKEPKALINDDVMDEDQQPMPGMGHDGVSDRKFVPLVGDGNIDDVLTKPAKVILIDDRIQAEPRAGGAKRPRRRGRSRAGRGRGKGPKETP